MAAGPRHSRRDDRARRAGTGTASRDHADVLLGQARQHLNSARAIAGVDPVGGYQLLYDAARKALAAVLENQGLRATSRGGHIAVRDAVSAQLDPPLGAVLRPFDRLRRRRNQAEYGPDDGADAGPAVPVERSAPADCAASRWRPLR